MDHSSGAKNPSPDMKGKENHCDFMDNECSLTVLASY